MVDILFSLSATSPTMPTGYNYKRRIGSFKTDASSHILAFSQNGDEFLWAAAVNDVDTATLGTTATLYALSVPPGVQVRARLRGAVSASSAWNALLNSPDEAVTASNSPAGNTTAFGVGSAVASYTCDVRTSTAQQIRAVSSVASTYLWIVTYGWLDARGRNN